MMAEARPLFSCAAAATLGAIVCTPTVKTARSGVSSTRPVPLTLTVSAGADTGGSAVGACAEAGMASSVAARTAKRLGFMLGSFRVVMFTADEGDHPRRRIRHAALPPDARRQQAARADLRQAHDLLSPVHADAGGHPRDPRHYYTPRPGKLPPPPRRRRRARHPHRLCRAAAARGPGPGLRHRP